MGVVRFIRGHGGDASPADPRSKLTLREYRELISDLPRPTEEQMLNFAQFVSGAHSWYKQLPIVPNSGRERGALLSALRREGAAAVGAGHRRF